MFNNEKELKELNLNNKKDIPMILTNINNPIIKEKIVNLGRKFAFIHFNNEQNYYVIKNSDDPVIKEIAMEELIFNSFSNEHFIYLEKLVNEIPESHKFIKENLDDILFFNQNQLNAGNIDKKYNILTGINQELLYDISNISYYYELISYVEDCCDDKERLEKHIISNIRLFIENSSDPENLLNFFNSSSIIKNSPKVLDDNIDLISAKLLKTTLDGLEKENLSWLYTLFVKDLLKYENINLSEIEYIDRGHFCSVYKFGDLAVKFGKNVIPFKVAKHPRIIRPIIRRNIPNSDRYIECQFYANCGNFTTEDAYNLYKELRDDGIVWVDCKTKNMGRLTRENINYYHGMEASDEAIGFVDRDKCANTVLQPGDYVIIDDQLTFYEDELDLDYLKTLNIDLSNYYNYESIYQSEKLKENKGRLLK